MKLLVLSVACSLLLTAQESKEKAAKFAFCGHASSHACTCIRHTQAVQDSYLASCRSNSKSEQQLRECLAKMPGHCSIVDRPDPVDDEAGEGQPAMSDRCTMMCNKHDCFCDDGPPCHVAHSASDHTNGKR